MRHRPSGRTHGRDIWLPLGGAIDLDQRDPSAIAAYCTKEVAAMKENAIHIGNTVDLYFPNKLRTIGKVGGLGVDRVIVHVETMKGLLTFGVPYDWLQCVRPNRWSVELPSLPNDL
jgi:hypothetical protein